MGKFLKVKYLKVSFIALLVLPSSTNYKLRDYGFGAGSQGMPSSTNYEMQGVVGEVGGNELSGTNYNLGPGFIFTQQANVPDLPTFENTANYYNKLVFTVDPSDNPSDSKFAIAISDDDFVTTNYIQDDNTVGSSLGIEDYQTYANWGGAGGEFVIGLASDTTYKIKVKALSGAFTETGFGPIAQATTVSPNISFAIGGVASETPMEGITTDVTTTSTQVPFGGLNFNQTTQAANSLTVTTNAVSGYMTTVVQVGDFKADSGTVFPQISGINSVPSIWPTNVVTGAYGYHTSDDSLGTGNTNRFLSDDTFAQFETTAYEVAFNSAPVTSEVTSLIYSIEVGLGEEAGSYSHTITYIVTGVF